MAAASGPSRLLVVGANHRSSALALRERLYVAPHGLPALLARLRDAGIRQALVLATCDRVEVDAVHDDPGAAAASALAVLAAHAGADPGELERQCYRLEGRAALRHLFGVAASLDSLVVGEPQILGQVKESHRVAQEQAMIGPELGGMLAAAYRAAKRVRTETSIGERPVSIAAAAERLARNIHGALDRCAALLVGAGEMGELIADHLRRAGLGRIVVSTRISAQAEELARRHGGHYAPIEELARSLADADIVITAVAAGRHIVTRPMVEAALAARRRKPIFLIDAAVPGDVEPAVNALDSAFVYDLADLEAIAVEGLAGRDAAAQAAAGIVEEEVSRYFRDQAGREASPLVAALRAHFEAVRRDALNDAPDDPAAATRLLVNRLLHGPSDALRRMTIDGSGSADEAARLIARLFGVSAGDEPDGSEPARKENRR
jgi:glutamyl-tRNA reductase